jgi:Flp pilus assembly protein TadG
MRAFSLLRRFCSDAKGNIAILFGLAIIPVVGAMGVAVDYSLANASRTALQASLDNTGLMLAKMMPLNDTDLNTRGWQIFQSNLGMSPLVFQQSDLHIQQTSSTLTLDISTTYNTQLASVLKLIGARTSFPVGSHTEVSWGNTRLRVALVLDNTGSMSQSGKIGALQTATTNLINQLKSVATTNGDVYISIIPFSRDVNVGASNYNTSWIDWTNWDASTGQTNGTCSVANGPTPSACTAAHCSNSSYTTKNNCQSHSATWYSAGTGVWTPDHSTWNGCVMDRGTNTAPGTSAGYDQKIDAPGGAVPGFPADQYSACTLAIMGLSYDWTALTNIVNSMTPNGSTNQPIGLVWGWQSLVGGGPLTAPAMDANYTYNQYIILLSDGLNTQDRWYGNGSATSISVDDRMYYQSGSTISGTCKNIKDAGIKIYTVQVDTGGDPTSTLLQNCASDPSMFFKLTSSTEIVTTFQQIGNALANLHLSQ